MNSNRVQPNLSIKVLMLEDNPDDAALIVRQLASHGLFLEKESENVRNGRDFIDRVGNRRYDLIISDFTLPGWNGLEALRWVRNSGNDTPFIYVSGTIGEEVAVECIREGATDYVLKSNLSRLPHAIRRALDECELRRTKLRIEREKKESEEHYRILFEGNPEPMWVWNRSSLAFLAVNDAAVQNYGYSREEFLQMILMDIVPKEDVPESLRSTLREDRSGISRRVEVVKHIKKDKSVIDVEVSRNAVIFRGIEATLALAHDITEHKKNEERLRASEERFAKAFRSSPMAITISTKAEGRYIDANDAFLRMLGRQRDEIAGHTVSDLGVWEAPEDRMLLIQELDRTGRVSALETRFRSKSRGVRSVQIAAESIRLGNVSCILSIITDVTSAKSMEEQFRQAQKMEAVGRLAGGVAHDFNNMLSVIIGYCDLAQDHSDLELVRKDVRQVKKAAQRAAKLTGQLLAFSRQQVLRPCNLNLNTVVTDILQMLLRVIAADIKLVFQPSDKLRNIKADLGHVEQILMNLVVNARDAMPDGGTIIIETVNVELDENYVRDRPQLRPGSYVMLSVSDTGSGMDAVTMSKIFDPFFTTKSPGMGTGLGLSMVYGAMEQANGHVFVYSEVGRGTAFKLYFPTIEGDVEQPFVPKADVVIGKGSETVLLVEDESDLRELTKELLESEGYQVLAAEDGQQALNRSEAYSGSIDVLLTDVILPGQTGRHIADRISASRPGVKVLYMSGYTGALIAKQGVLDPGVALLSKPFSKNELLSQVRSVLDR